MVSPTQFILTMVRLNAKAYIKYISGTDIKWFNSETEKIRNFFMYNQRASTCSTKN